MYLFLVDFIIFVDFSKDNALLACLQLEQCLPYLPWYRTTIWDSSKIDLHWDLPKERKLIFLMKENVLEVENFVDIL